MRADFTKSRIVCTIGPASAKKEVMSKLIAAGMDVARLNFSHGKHEDHKAAYDMVRAEARRAGMPVAVLADLQGIKIRTGTFPEGGIMLKTGQRVTLVPGTGVGSKDRIYISCPSLAQDAKKGDRILINDGLVRLVAEAKNKGEIIARVIEGGMVKDRKGVNLPGVRISTKTFTPKDRRDLEYALKLGVDYVAISFVRKADDVRKVRRHMVGSDALLISKIEKPEALEDIDAIIAESDGIMVARGDLGVEVSYEDVPIIQKQLIERANRAGKLVITATQMLESMTGQSTPTRAEANDVANAVIDGSDALMLSAETSAGKYPVESCAMMDRIIRKTESAVDVLPTYLERKSYSESVAWAAAESAEGVGAKFIVAFTHSGYTAMLLSKYRSHVPIIAYTPFEHVQRRMALYWGVMPRIMRRPKGTDQVFAAVERDLLKAALVKKGDTIAITASAPIGGAGKTNLMKLHKVGG